MTSPVYHSDRNEENPVLEAALRYAGLGYPVIPLLPGDKKPHGRLVPNGKDDASTDPETIRRWFTESPSSNLGLLTDGLLVVDIDGQNNPWPNDPEKGADLAEAGAVAETGRKGKHIVYRKPEDKNWRNSTGALAPNVDTKTDGGYIVVWPSAGYRWIEGLELDRSRDDLPEPPEWLAEMLDTKRAKRPGGRKGGTKADHVEDIPDGQRNSTLFSIGCAHRRIGSSEQAILAALMVVNDERCKPPLPADEVEKIAASAAKYEFDQCATDMAEGLHREDETEPEADADQGADGTLTDWGNWTPFPVREVFEEYTADFLCSIAEALNLDPAMAAVPALSILAGAIGLNRRVLLRKSSQWIQYPVLWTAAASDPGTKKSAVMSILSKPIRKADEAAVEEYKRDFNNYVARAKEWQAKNDAGEEPGRHPCPPVLREFMLDDFTSEAAAHSIANNPRGLLIAESELESLFASAMRYNSTGDHFRVFLQKMFDWEQIKVSRRGNGELTRVPTFVKGALSISGMIQPTRWAACIKAAEKGSGFAQRWLICMPPEKSPRDPGAEAIPICRAEAWDEIISQFLRLDLVETPLTLDDGAQASFDSYDHHLEVARSEVHSVSEKGQTSKLAGIAGRIALVLHMVESAITGQLENSPTGNLFENPIGPMVISEKTMVAAITCAEWFRGRMAHTSKTGRESVQKLEDEPIIEFIESIGGKVRPRDLQRHNNRRWPKADDAKLTLERLTESKPPRLRCIKPGQVWRLL